MKKRDDAWRRYECQLFNSSGAGLRRAGQSPVRPYNHALIKDGNAEPKCLILNK
jgi:hypothetical protein